MSITTLITGLAAPITNLVSEFVEDVDKKNELESKIKTLVETQANEIDKKAADVIMAEIKSDSWMAKNFRPCMMFLFMFLIAWNAIVVPILWAFGYPLPTLEAMSAIPDQMWTLLIVGMSGYVGSRGAEKIMKTWTEGKKNNGSDK